jgi:hypothetical protein
MPWRPSRLAIPAIALSLIAGPLAACGGDDDDETNETDARKPAPTVLKVRALRSGDDVYRFDVKRLEAKAGPVTIDFRNDDDTAVHNIRIQTGSKCCFGPQNKDVGGTNTIDGGVRRRATLTLKPGRYVFLCSLGGHWNSDIGKMRGTLIVS